jgi:endonuclease/exonuclease/phosphatase family metal-dependent hydrolase
MNSLSLFCVLKYLNFNRIATIIFIGSVFSCSLPADRIQKSNKMNTSVCRIAFYNVENLFDTKDDTHINDNDFLPTSKLKWTDARYKQKLEHTYSVIQGLNEKESLALIGLSEVENKQVLEDLLVTDSTFKIIHFNSSDKRGIDVALLYSPQFFTPLTTYLSNDKKTDVFLREVLVVKGVLWKDTIHVLINHWPSRREGEKESEHKRVAAARLNVQLIDSIFAMNAASTIFVMGDFNDQPNNRSVEMLSIAPTLASRHKDVTEVMINPFKVLQQAGEGTCKYKKDWLLFDQIMMSNSVMNKKGLQYLTAEIYDPIWLYYKQDHNSGPFRTYVGNKYVGGYSDHFPVYVELKK